MQQYWDDIVKFLHPTVSPRNPLSSVRL